MKQQSSWDFYSTFPYLSKKITYFALEKLRREMNVRASLDKLQS